MEMDSVSNWNMYSDVIPLSNSEEQPICSAKHTLAQGFNSLKFLSRNLSIALGQSAKDTKSRVITEQMVTIYIDQLGTKCHGLSCDNSPGPEPSLNTITIPIWVAVAVISVGVIVVVALSLLVIVLLIKMRQNKLPKTWVKLEEELVESDAFSSPTTNQALTNEIEMN
jgi:hypothetical protein